MHDEFGVLLHLACSMEKDQGILQAPPTFPTRWTNLNKDQRILART